MPFKSKAQQRYLFAKKPVIAREFADHTPKGAYKKLPEHAKKATVTKDDLVADGPTPVKDRTLKLLGPTDPPTQEVKNCDRKVETMKPGVKQAAQECLILTLAHLTKQAAERRDLDHVRDLSKLAMSYAATRDLNEAIAMCYPTTPNVKRDSLKSALIQKTAELRKESGALVNAADWLEKAPGKAWGSARNMMGNAWQGISGAVDRNITQPMSTVTKPIGNFFNRVWGAFQGARQGWNSAVPQPPTPAPAPTPPGGALAAPGAGRFQRKIALTQTVPVSMPKHAPAPSRNMPLAASAIKRRTRFSFNGTPSNTNAKR